MGCDGGSRSTDDDAIDVVGCVYSSEGEWQPEPAVVRSRGFEELKVYYGGLV